MKKFLLSLLTVFMALSASAATKTVYKQITSIKDVVDGGTYVVLAEGFDYAMHGSAYKTTYIYSIEVPAPSNGVIKEIDDAFIWTFKELQTGKFSLYNAYAGKYVSSNGNNNNAKLVDEDDASHFTITVDDNGVFRFADDLQPNRSLQFNKNDNAHRFACYKNTQNDLRLFKAEIVEVSQFDLGAPSYDSETAYDDAALTLTFPEAENTEEATSESNSYYINGTIQIGDGKKAKTVEFSSTSSASEGAIVSYEFESGTAYTVIIPAKGIVLASATSSTDTLAVNNEAIVIRVSDAELMDATFDFTAATGTYGFANAENLDGFSDQQADIIFTAAANGGKNSPAYYTLGDALRIYASNTITLSSDAVIRKVVYKWADNYAPSSTNFSITPAESYTFDKETMTTTWEGVANEVVVKNIASSGQFRVATITVTFEEITDDEATAAAKESLYEEIYKTKSLADGVELYGLKGVNIFQYRPAEISKLNDMANQYLNKAQHIHSEVGVYEAIADVRKAAKSIHPTMPLVTDQFLIQNIATGKYLDLSNGVTISDEGTPVSFHNILMQPKDYILMSKVGAFLYHSLYIYNTPERDYLGYLNDLSLTNKQDTQWYVIMAGGNKYIIATDSPYNNNSQPVSPVRAKSRDGESAESLVISFDQALDKGALNGKTVGSDGFTLSIIDTKSSMSVDKSLCNFGTPDEYTDFTYRLKTGGKSNADRVLTLSVPSSGTLNICVRPSGTSKERTLVAYQNGKEIFNEVIDDTSLGKGENKKDIYKVRSFEVVEGEVNLTFPVDGLNFYSFELVSDASSGDDMQEMKPSFLGVENGKKVILTPYGDEVFEELDNYYWNILYYFAPEEDANNSESGESSTDPATSINGVSEASVPVAIYSADGAQLKAAKKGLNIVKMADGSIRKVFVK